MKKLSCFLLAVVLLLGAICVLNGCKKEEPVKKTAGEPI